LSNELPHTHLIILGATAVLSNGSLLASRGSAAVVYLARSYNIPVLCTVKSYQFIDKVSPVVEINLIELF
jgi:translation initiation factor 2B subunit (eIF-2B alpha/beta/delta family)